MPAADAPAPPAPEPEPAPAPAIVFTPEPAPEAATAPRRHRRRADDSEIDDADAGGADTALTSPIVRRLVAEHGLDVATIRGQWPGWTHHPQGRARRRALAPCTGVARAGRLNPRSRSRRSRRPRRSRAVARTGAASPSLRRSPHRSRPRAPSSSGRDETIPFDNIRRRTAEHMVRSKATSAHVYTSVEVDYERVERVRAAHGAAWKGDEGFSLTYLPFIARAFCDTVREFPKVNASVGDDALIVHHDVNLSIAVDLDFEGLVAPVIRDADGKRLRLIAREMHDLADRARSKKLVPDDVLGGTFTITNPGPFGTYATHGRSSTSPRSRSSRPTGSRSVRSS